MSASALSVQPQPRHPASREGRDRVEEGRRHPWLNRQLCSCLSSYPVPWGTPAGHPMHKPSLTCSPPQPAHQPCTRRPRTGSCGCAAACTGHRAHSHPRMGTGRCATALQPSHCGIARTCEHTRSWLFESRAIPNPAPAMSPIALAHRGPTPQRERRVRNQVPVCGKGIRSLATLDVTLTERRKPERDSKGESMSPGERSGQHGVRTHFWEPSLPLFPIPIPTFGTGHSSIPQAQGHLMSQASKHCYIFLVQGTLSRVKMQMRLSDPWGGPP